MPYNADDGPTPPVLNKIHALPNFQLQSHPSSCFYLYFYDFFYYYSVSALTFYAAKKE